MTLSLFRKKGGLHKSDTTVRCVVFYGIGCKVMQPCGCDRCNRRCEKAPSFVTCQKFVKGFFSTFCPRQTHYSICVYSKLQKYKYIRYCLTNNSGSNQIISYCNVDKDENSRAGTFLSLNSCLNVRSHFQNSSRPSIFNVIIHRCSSCWASPSRVARCPLSSSRQCSDPFSTVL